MALARSKAIGDMCHLLAAHIREGQREVFRILIGGYGQPMKMTIGLETPR